MDTVRVAIPRHKGIHQLAQLIEGNVYRGISDSAVGALFFRRMGRDGYGGRSALQNLSVIGQLVKHLARGKLAIIGMVAVNLARSLPVLPAFCHQWQQFLHALARKMAVG